VRETEARARQANEDFPSEAPDGGSRGGADPETEHIEEAFRQALGTRVRLLRGRRGGRLVIHFYSDEELQGLYEAIVRG
jgi:ParB family chromosome partitioning protein